MAEPIPVEVAQRVVAERAPVMGGARPSDALVGKAINAMKDARQESGLNIAANRESNPGILSGLRDQNIGYTDENGVKQEDTVRKDRAEKRQVLYDEFSKKNYDDLTGAQQDLLVVDAANAIKNLPGMAGHFASLPPGTNIDTLAEEMAVERLRNDPNFKKGIIDLFLDRNDPSKPIEDKVTSAVAKEEELKKQRDTLEEQNDNLKDEITKKEKRLKEHQVHISGRGGGREGTVYREILDAKAEAATKQSEIDALDLDVTQLTGELSGLNDELRVAQAFATGNTRLPTGAPTPRSPADVNAEITTKKGDIQTKKSQISTKRGEMEERKKKVDSLEAERTKLEDSLETLKKEQKKAEDELNKVDGSYKSQQAEVRKLKALKVLAEESWVQSLESITREATITLINNELKEALVKVKVLQEERAKEQTDGGKKKFWEYEKQQYVAPDGKPNKAIINADRVSLMRAGTEYQFTLANGNVEKIFLNGAEQTLVDVMVRGGMTNDEIYNLVKDPVNRTEMSTTLAQDILTTHLWSGGRISRGEIVAIHRSDWGKGMVAKAIAGRADLQAQIDAAIGKGVLNWHEDILAQLGKIDWAKFALILLIVAGGFTLYSMLKK